MEKYVRSTDYIIINYKETGAGNTALVFVHGWLGNTNWWEDQEKYFSNRFRVVCIDLGGHGQSEKTRKNWTGKQYADDILAVVNQLDVAEIILVGHSMSGAYAVEASMRLPKVKAIVLVDTLKDLGQEFTPEQAEEYMFRPYRKDFKAAVEDLLPQYLFVSSTPEAVQKRLQNEFLQNDVALVIDALRPLYEMDIRHLASQIDIPVVAINSDASPTNIDSNRMYFKNYACKLITGTGHYPMLERPDEFNNILDELLNELTHTS